MAEHVEAGRPKGIAVSSRNFTPRWNFHHGGSGASGAPRLRKAPRLATAALLIAVLASVPGQADPVEIHDEHELAPEEGCAVPDQGAGATETITEGPWVPGYTVNADGLPMREAVKSILVEWNSPLTNGEVVMPGDAEPSLESQVYDCSSGVCAVDVHVYANATMTAKAGVGYYGFLPFFFAVGGKVEVREEISTHTESKIVCGGEFASYLHMAGGVPPQTAYASVQESNGKQSHASCTYVDPVRGCWMPFIHEFELEATHPGKFTRFDVVNGGRFNSALTVEAPHTFLSVNCRPQISSSLTPNMPIDTLLPVCLGEAGEWRVVFKHIEIDVNTDEAVAMLANLV